MRLRVSLLVAAALLAGCSTVDYRRGLPILAKPQDGDLVSGTEGSADIGRGNQARLSGRYEDAIRDLEPMAQRGYADAQLYLAAVYGQQVTLESQALAIHWYRRVLRARPEAAVPLARVLLQSGKRKQVLEAEQLLNTRRKQSDDPLAEGALLTLYALFPTFDTNKVAPDLAAHAIRSDVPDVRAAAIYWYRSAVTDRASAKRLLDLCRVNLDAAPECYIDLAGFYRYSGDRKGLEALVSDAMQAFDRRAPVDHVDTLDYVPIDLALVSARLAVALVEQPGNEDLVEQADEARTQRSEDEIAAFSGAEDNADGKVATGDIAPQTADATPAVASAPPATEAAPAPAVNAAPDLANSILRWMLKHPGTMKVEAAGVAVGYPYLLPDVDLVALLKTGIDEHHPRASLLLGELYLFNQRAPREADLAESNFIEATKYRDTIIPAHYRLGRLYQQGYLSRPDPKKSLENFLYAARRRVTAADTHLARLFYDSPGTRINRVNAYVFARLSEDAGFPVLVRTLRGGTLNVFNLLERLKTDLTAQELEKAEAMYLKEREVHLVTPRQIGPEIWMPGAAG